MVKKNETKTAPKNAGKTKKKPEMTDVKESGVTTTTTPFLKDKGSAGVKAAMTPPPMRASGAEATIIPMNAGGPALAASAAPAAEAISLVELSRQWADAKRMEAQGKREADGKRKEIIEHFGTPEKTIGFSNNFINVTSSDKIEYDDPKLTIFLKEKGWFDACAKPQVLDPDKVKSKAITEPDLEKLLESITKKDPKFNQVRDTKD